MVIDRLDTYVSLCVKYVSARMGSESNETLLRGIGRTHRRHTRMAPLPILAVLRGMHYAPKHNMHADCRPSDFAINNFKSSSTTST